MNKRIIAVALTALALGATLEMPAAAEASTASKTGTVSIALTSATGHRITIKGVLVILTKYAAGYHDHVYTNSKGIAKFTKVPAGVVINARALYTSANPAYIQGNRKIEAVRGESITRTVAMPLGATISGVLKNGEGQPLKGAVVYVSDGKHIPKFARTNASGKYVARGLETGKWKVLFNDHLIFVDETSVSKNYGESFYTHGTSLSTATAVSVIQQSATKKHTAKGGISGTVVPGFSLTGTLVNDTGSNDVGVIYINAVNEKVQVNNFAGTADHSFSARLLPGDYTLAFYALDGKQLYYTGDATAPSFDEADAAIVHFDATADQHVTITFPPPAA